MSGGEPSSIKQYVPCDIVNSFGCMLNYMITRNIKLLSEVRKLYQALYRKWRPKTFDDVSGQDHITKTLKSEVISGRISHAYLFTGSRGTGKTSCAKILAKAVNCLSSVGGNPCLKCDMCKHIESDNMLDIVEIDAASNNGVENIRSMREEVVFSPAKCKYRVYIVDEVHMLSTGAFNAFLKVLEEPPAHVIFVLATTEIHKLPATIISRCQRFDFHRIMSEDIFKRIKYICEKEKIKIEDNAAEIIAESVDGGMRDALSILDQCANSCGNNINAESVKKILGITGTEYLSELISFISNNQPAKCLELIDKMHNESKNMLKLCEEIMEYFRRIMICKVTKEIDFSQPQNIDLDKINLEDILFSLDVLQESYKNMCSGTNKKLEMEIALVKLCSKFKSNKDSPQILNNIKNNAPQKPQIPVVAEKTESLPTPKTFVQTHNENALQCWVQILEALKNEKSLKSLYISLRDSSAYEQGNYILIDSANSLAFELLRRNEYRSAIKKIIKDITGKQYSLGPYTAENQNQNDARQNDPFDILIETANKGKIQLKLN